MKPIPAVVLMWSLHSKNKVPNEVYRSLRKTNTTFISAKKKEAKKYRQTHTVNELTLTEGQDMFSVSDEILTRNKTPSNNLRFTNEAKKKYFSLRNKSSCCSNTCPLVLIFHWFTL